MNFIYAGANDSSESFIFLTLKITNIFSLKKGAQIIRFSINGKQFSLCEICKAVFKLGSFSI